MKRDDGIDTIRVLLTFLVVIHHVSIVYGGAGSWYWKETQPLNFSLIVFNTVNQSFFMGFFFLLAGYFSRHSIDRKGTKIFLLDRFIRLGIPLLVYFFIISPFTIALAHPSPGVSLITRTLQMAQASEFEPGPLWFVFSLLIFSCLLALIYHYKPTLIGSLSKIPNTLTIALTLISLGACTFAVRLLIPVGETVVWLQLGYFPMYIVLFILGVFAFQNRLLTSIEFSNIKIWLPIAVLLISILPFIMDNPLGNGPFEGGANLNALFYALWEPFVACGIILSALYFFTVRSHSLNHLFKPLSPLAYGIYIIHPPIVVATSITLHSWQQDVTTKLLVNSGISIAACIALSWFILKLPYIRRVL